MRSKPSRWIGRGFGLACAIEGSLVLVAVALAALLAHPLLSDLHWSARDLMLGLAAAAPPWVFFRWLMGTGLRPIARARERLITGLGPLFSSWSLLHLATLSVVAGISEEILFRSVVQGALSDQVGPAVALIVASVLFGCAHLVTLTYAIIASVIGAYFGVLWLLGGNLLVPIVTHAAYDFAALVYWLRVWRPRAGG